MISTKEVNWNSKDEQLSNDVLRRHRDEDLRDDDMISSDRRDSKLPGADVDDDDANLSDNDRTGRDLAVDNGDEFDAGNFGDDLDRIDHDDDDEMNVDIHSVKNDQFGSLAQSISNSSEPDPDEIPEEHEVGNSEVTEPGEGGVEHGKDNEADYKHECEVNPPQPEHKRNPTEDSTASAPSTGIEHPRTTERIADHEPGNVAGDRRAPNL